MAADTLETQRAQAEQVARDWIDAFNSHDLERILALYCDDLVLQSEIYLKYSDGNARMSGKDELRRYFGRALERYPDLTFTVQQIFPGVGSVCVVYRTSARDHLACECMTFSRDGRIRQVLAHYGD